MTLRRGESLLLTVAIPVSSSSSSPRSISLPTGTSASGHLPRPGHPGPGRDGDGAREPVHRHRLRARLRGAQASGATPLGRPSLLGAKIAAVVVVEILQAVVLVAVAPGPRLASERRRDRRWPWRSSCWPRPGSAAPGLFLAGVLRAEVNLAAANGLWLLLLLVSGMVSPLSKLPGWLAGAWPSSFPRPPWPRPSTPPSEPGGPVPVWAWLVLVLWAVLAPLLAVMTFRWE